MLNLKVPILYVYQTKANVVESFITLTMKKNKKSSKINYNLLQSEYVDSLKNDYIYDTLKKRSI